MWPTKMKVDWPYSKIGRKMANGQLLFCALSTELTYSSLAVTHDVLRY